MPYTYCQLSFRLKAVLKNRIKKYGQSGEDEASRIQSIKHINYNILRYVCQVYRLICDLSVLRQSNKDTPLKR